MKFHKIWIIGTCLILLLGCQKKTAPDVSPSQVVDAYLLAMKAQDGNEMAKYTLSGKGDDFSISEEDASAIGLEQEVLQQFYAHVLSFTYTITEESIQLEEDRAEVVVHVQTYDVLSVLNAGVEAHKEEFGNIKGGAGSDEEKSHKIAEILIKEFETAEQTYDSTYTFSLDLAQDAWKIKDEEATAFYQVVLNTSLEE